MLTEEGNMVRSREGEGRSERARVTICEGDRRGLAVEPNARPGPAGVTTYDARSAEPRRPVRRGRPVAALLLGVAVGIFAARGAVAQTRATDARRVADAYRGAGPRYAPVKQEVDAGKVTRGKLARFEFVIRNTGTQKLLLEVTPNCNCTVPTYDREIAPGARGKVVAELRTADLNGYVTKTLSVKTNDPKRPTAGLYLIATVVSIVEVTPSESFILPLKDEGPTGKDVIVRLKHGETAEITGATSMVPGLKAALERLPDSRGRRTYRLALTALETMPIGAVTARVVLRTTSESEPEIRLTVRCEKGIIATPASVYMGVIPPTPPKPLMRLVTLTRRFGALRLLRVSSSDPNIRVEWAKLEGAEAYRLKVRYASGWAPGWVQQLLTVETDNARQPRLLIPVMARVTDVGSAP